MHNDKEFEVKSRYSNISIICNIIFLAMFAIIYILLHHFLPSLLINHIFFINVNNIDKIFFVLIAIHVLLIVLNLILIFMKFNKFIFSFSGILSAIVTLPFSIISLIFLYKGLKDYQKINDIGDQIIVAEPKIISNINSTNPVIEINKDTNDLVDANINLINTHDDTNNTNFETNNLLNADNIFHEHKHPSDTTSILVDKVIDPNNASINNLGFNSKDKVVNLDSPSMEKNSIILPKYGVNEINNILETNNAKPKTPKKISKAKTAKKVKSKKPPKTKVAKKSKITKTIKSKTVKKTKPKKTVKVKNTKKPKSKKPKKLQKSKSSKKPASVKVRNKKLRNKL